MPRTLLDPRLKTFSEAQLQSAIIELAERTGWFVTYHPDALKRLAYAALRSGRGGGGRWPRKGFPDLLMARRRGDEPTRVIVAELKSHTGQVKPEQQAWLDELAGNDGIEVHIFRPEDWIDGSIEGVLT